MILNDFRLLGYKVKYQVLNAADYGVPQTRLSEREIGWCLTGIGDVIDCNERLDKEKPYDSELSPHQTAEAKVIKNGRNSVVLKLLTRDGETIGITRIHD